MITAAQFIKQTTTVPEPFVDELFEFYDEKTLPTDFVINIEHIVKWLQASKRELTKTLRTTYKLNIDYTKTKTKNAKSTNPKVNNYALYMLTPDCFKMLCMSSNAKNAHAVRRYFVEVESMYIKYRQVLIDGMTAENNKLLRNQRPKSTEPKAGYIYVFKAHESLNLHRIGRSSNLKRRITQHQSSHADDIEILYRFRTDDIVFVESCVHKALKDKKYRKYKEVFEADLDMIKMLLNKCSGVIDARKDFESKKAPKQSGGYFFMFDDGSISNGL